MRQWPRIQAGREKEKQEHRTRVRDTNVTPSSPREGLEEHPSAGRMYRGFEMHVWILKGHRLGTP